MNSNLGEGGMMAYRMVHLYPATYAALWVLSASHGSRAHDARTNVVENVPWGPPVSLFVHYGQLDEFVVPTPGPLGQAVPVLSVADVARQETESGNALASEIWARSDLVPTQAADKFASHNATLLDESSYVVGAAAPFASVLAGASSTVRVRVREPGQLSPQVTTYFDPWMTHKNLTGNPLVNLTDLPLNPVDLLLYLLPPWRYMFPANVWAWFKLHVGGP